MVLLQFILVKKEWLMFKDTLRLLVILYQFFKARFVKELAPLDCSKIIF